MQQRVAIYLDWSDAVAQIYELNYVNQGAYWINLYATYHGRLPGIHLGHNQAGNLLAASFNGNGQSAPNAANSPIEGQFADKEAV